MLGTDQGCTEVKRTTDDPLDYAAKPSSKSTAVGVLAKASGSKRTSSPYDVVAAVSRAFRRTLAMVWRPANFSLYSVEEIPAEPGGLDYIIPEKGGIINCEGLEARIKGEPV
jgi:hypothetical protein